MRLNETEKRAVFAEQSVKSYLKELDMREGRRKKTFNPGGKKLKIKMRILVRFQSVCASKRKSSRIFAATWTKRSPSSPATETNLFFCSLLSLLFFSFILFFFLSYQPAALLLFPRALFLVSGILLR